MLVLDSGFSRHVTGSKSLLTNVVMRTGSVVVFGNDGKGFTAGYGKMKVGNVIIEDISLMEGLKHNLLSISQFCDKGYDVTFQKEICLIQNRKHKDLTLRGEFIWTCQY